MVTGKITSSDYGSRGLDTALWVIEGYANFRYPKPDSFYVLYADSFVVNMNVSGGRVSGGEMVATFNQLDAFIANGNTGSIKTDVVVTDIKTQNLNGVTSVVYAVQRGEKLRVSSTGFGCTFPDGVCLKIKPPISLAVPDFGEAPFDPTQEGGCDTAFPPCNTFTGAQHIGLEIARRAATFCGLQPSCPPPSYYTDIHTVNIYTGVYSENTCICSNTSCPPPMMGEDPREYSLNGLADKIKDEIRANSRGKQLIGVRFLRYDKLLQGGVVKGRLIFELTFGNCVRVITRIPR